ncbi:MAG: hypothetical protein ACM3N9_08155 [Syntrophothermus sp.]
MKRNTLLFLLLIPVLLLGQSPQKFTYQAIVRNGSGKLIQSSPVTLRLSILQGSTGGTSVYSEIHSATTNANGLVTVFIGEGLTTNNLNSIDWSQGPYFLQTEVDPAGGNTFSLTGVSQLVSVPYALYSAKSADAFSGDYNDLTNKPVTDGSETHVKSGFNIKVSGNGKENNPYVIDNLKDPVNTIVITSSQTFTVPNNIFRMRVELWGGAGGGGGAGTYSYSYNINNGGDGGSGGYLMKELATNAGSQYYIEIGQGGYAGSNAYYPYYYGDTDGGDGGMTWLGGLQAAGGKGGKRGSFSSYTVNGSAGTQNTGGDVSAFAEPSNHNVLNVFQGLERSYIYNRTLTSRPGAGGSIHGYSTIVPKQGESGCAIITLWER